MSLRLRLAVWYGGLTGLVVALVSLFTYTVHSRGQYDDLDRLLLASAEHVAAEYMLAATAQERSAMLAIPIGRNLAVRVYDADGRTLVTGPDAALAPPTDPRTVLSRPAEPPFDPLVRLTLPFVTVDPGRGAYGLTNDAGGGRWRLYVLPIELFSEYVVLAASLAAIDASVAEFRRLVPLLAALGAAACFLGGLLLAGNALRPIATLTETAGAIARSRGFSRRVPMGSRHDELGQLAATFNDMLGSLEQAYRAQQRFVGDASHELRAPLTAIQANLELLERRPDLRPAERQEAVSEASREARRLAQLVADLLALARADAGVPLRRERVELDRLLLEALAAARHLARGQRLEVDALEPALVEGDPDRLKQLLLILLDNAIKHTPPSGRVTLELRRDGATAAIVVDDTGVGIPPEDLPRVFDRFYRADPARARDPGGTGLGLPIARWIAEQHGGRIRLTSEPGRGTTASIHLPISR